MLTCAGGACHFRQRLLAASVLAYEIRFDATNDRSAIYLAFTAVLPLIWLAFLALAGGYDKRFVGVGSDEFNRC